MTATEPRFRADVNVSAATACGGRFSGVHQWPVMGGSGYVPLSALAEADGWILVPADSEGYPPGAEVVIRPFP